VRAATQIASERVRAKYGFACSRAQDQLLLIEELGSRFDAQSTGAVEVVSFDEEAAA
jgi:uncharacterized repeat protein (TIGR04042 family)